MTIEEKRKAIEEYCESKSNCTVGQMYPCPLYCLSRSCYYDDSCIDENFKLVSEMPDYTGQKEEPAATHTKPSGIYDNVNHPQHYNHGSMECIDEMILIFGIDAVMDFCVCNAWKYRARAAYKGNPEEDMAKADWYLAKYKELEEMSNGIYRKLP